LPPSSGELAIYTALNSAAMLMLLLLLLLALYTHLDPTRPKPSSSHSVDLIAFLIACLVRLRPLL
jgi:hypothetical protein